MKQESIPHRPITADDVAQIWREIDPALDIPNQQNWQIANTANYWNPSALAWHEQGDERKALEAAHRLLSDWCARRRREQESRADKLAPQLIEIGEERLLEGAFDARILVLETALDRTRELVAPPPDRQAPWTMPAVMVWQSAAFALESIGLKAGSSGAKSIAIRFTQRILGRLGYYTGPTGATDGAVAKAVKRFLEKQPSRVTQAT